jgi:hypothetical protein
MAYDVFKTKPHELKDRLVVPNINGENVYLFNYSVASIFKKTPLSRALMKMYVEDVEAQNFQGLSCITVSDDGVRIARRFGMSHSGNLNFQGSVEGVFVTTST